MTVKDLIKELQKIEDQNSLTVMADGKFNDMQVNDVEYTNEWCENCKKYHSITYLKQVKFGKAG